MESRLMRDIRFYRRTVRNSLKEVFEDAASNGWCVRTGNGGPVSWILDEIRRGTAVKVGRAMDTRFREDGLPEEWFSDRFESSAKIAARMNNDPRIAANIGDFCFLSEKKHYLDDLKSSAPSWYSVILDLLTGTGASLLSLISVIVLAGLLGALFPQLSPLIPVRDLILRCIPLAGAVGAVLCIVTVFASLPLVLIGLMAGAAVTFPKILGVFLPPAAAVAVTVFILIALSCLLFASIGSMGVGEFVARIFWAVGFIVFPIAGVVIIGMFSGAEFGIDFFNTGIDTVHLELWIRIIVALYYAGGLVMGLVRTVRWAAAGFTAAAYGSRERKKALDRYRFAKKWIGEWEKWTERTKEKVKDGRFDGDRDRIICYAFMSPGQKEALSADSGRFSQEDRELWQSVFRFYEVENRLG